MKGFSVREAAAFFVGILIMVACYLSGANRVAAFPLGPCTECNCKEVTAWTAKAAGDNGSFSAKVPLTTTDSSYGFLNINTYQTCGAGPLNVEGDVDMWHWDSWSRLCWNPVNNGVPPPAGNGVPFQEVFPQGKSTVPFPQVARFGCTKR